MGKGSSKIGPQPTTAADKVRTTHGIVLNGERVDFALNPMDVAREKEMGVAEKLPQNKKDGVAKLDFGKVLPEESTKERPSIKNIVPYKILSDHDLLILNSQRAENSAEFAADLVKLAEKFRDAATSEPSLNLESITPSQMQTYRIVAAAISRAHRKSLTPEQAEYQSKQGARRSSASRERMTPEKRAARNEKEAERLRLKRALAKAPQP